MLSTRLNRINVLLLLVVPLMLLPLLWWWCSAGPYWKKRTHRQGIGLFIYPSYPYCKGYEHIDRHWHEHTVIGVSVCVLVAVALKNYRNIDSYAKICNTVLEESAFLLSPARFGGGFLQFQHFFDYPLGLMVLRKMKDKSHFHLKKGNMWNGYVNGFCKIRLLFHLGMEHYFNANHR